MNAELSEQLYGSDGEVKEEVQTRNTGGDGENKEDGQKEKQHTDEENNGGGQERGSDIRFTLSTRTAISYTVPKVCRI